MADDVTSTNTGGTDATTRADRVAGLERACRAARIADEFRSRDVVVLDLTAITPIVDYFVVASGTKLDRVVNFFFLVCYGGLGNA